MINLRLNTFYMKKRNFFANKNESSFLKLVNLITENVDDETEGLDFEDDDMAAEGDDTADLGEDDFADDEMDEDMISIDIPRSTAQTLYDILGAMLGSEEESSDFDSDEDVDFDSDEDVDFGSDEDVDAEDADMEDIDDSEEEDEEENEDEDAKEYEEDEEVLGSNQSNVAQSTISRNGAPKRSKANTSWNTGKTVKSVFDQTASGEGEPAGTSRDGAPKRSKFSKSWNNSKTVSSRLQPGKHIAEIGK